MTKTTIAIILISIVAFLLFCGMLWAYKVTRKIDSGYLINTILLIIAILLLA